MAEASHRKGALTLKPDTKLDRDAPRVAAAASSWYTWRTCKTWRAVVKNGLCEACLPSLLNEGKVLKDYLLAARDAC